MNPGTSRRTSRHRHRSHRHEIPAQAAPSSGERIYLPPIPPSIAEAIRAEVEKIQAAYLADTGEPMPQTHDGMKRAAVVAGFTAGEAVAGEYTLADIYDTTAGKKRAEERQAAAVAAAVAAALGGPDHAGRRQRRDRRADRSGQHEKPWTPEERELVDAWKAASAIRRIRMETFASQRPQVVRLSTSKARQGEIVRIVGTLQTLLARSRQQFHRRRRPKA
jgi:hypothetical protein